MTLSMSAVFGMTSTMRHSNLKGGAGMEWWRMPIINWQNSPWGVIAMARLSCGVPVQFINTKTVSGMPVTIIVATELKIE